MTAETKTGRDSSKLSVIIDQGGRVVGAASTVLGEATERDTEITSGVEAAYGQTVLSVDMPAGLTALDGPELLEKLATRPSVQSAIKNTPTAGYAAVGVYSIAESAAFSRSQQPAEISAGQAVRLDERQESRAQSFESRSITAGYLR